MSKKKRKPLILDGQVRDLAAGGDGVVATERGVVFVPHTVPGDQVSIALTSRGKASRGVLREVREPSPDRVEPPCVVAARCGGCPWMVVSRELQHEKKVERVSRAVGREVQLVSREALGQRRRARLSFANRQLGFFARRSDRIVDVSACVMLDDVLSRGLAAIRARLLTAWRGRGELSLAHGGDLADPRAVVCLRAESPQPGPLYQACEALVADGELAGMALSVDGSPYAMIGDPRERTAGADGKVLEGTVGGFSQANAAINHLLVAQVVAFAGFAPDEECSVLELYAGHGNLTIALASHATRCVSVESHREASERARENLAARHLSATVVAGDAEKPPRGRFDVVVLDPPREGARAAIPKILAARPSRIVYVSCHPETLGRDLIALEGYEVVDAVAFDMFPHTAHVETVVALRRASR